MHVGVHLLRMLSRFKIVATLTKSIQKGRNQMKRCGCAEKGTFSGPLTIDMIYGVIWKLFRCYRMNDIINGIRRRTLVWIVWCPRSKDAALYHNRNMCRITSNGTRFVMFRNLGSSVVTHRLSHRNPPLQGTRDPVLNAVPRVLSDPEGKYMNVPMTMKLPVTDGLLTLPRFPLFFRHLRHWRGEGN